MKKLFSFLLFSPLVFAQGGLTPTQQALKVVNGITSPIANATITVCAANTSGIPCSPALIGSIFKDSALTQPLSNPFTADSNGNYQFAIAGGQYTVTVSAAGFVGQTSQATVSCANNSTCVWSGNPSFTGNNTFTGANTFTGQFNCKNLENVKCVDGNNNQGWAGSDFGAWVNAAIASLPVVLPPLNDGVHTYPCGTILLYPPAGAINVTVATTISVNSPCVHFAGPGSGSLQLVCTMTSGDCIRMLSNPFNQNMDAGVQGFAMLGNSTLTSLLHIGDMNHVMVFDVMLQGATSTSAVASSNSTVTGGVGLWIDNVIGFTEQLNINHVWSINNQIGLKFTNSATNCPAFDTSVSYLKVLDMHFNVNASQIGMDIGPGVNSTNDPTVNLVMNGNGTGKTFFQMEAANGSCAAPTMLVNFFTLLSEDDGPFGGTVLNLATGTSLGGICNVNNLNLGTPMTNTLNGTLACTFKMGPTGTQPSWDSRTFATNQQQFTASTDSATVDMTIAAARSSPASVDWSITDIGHAGDFCTASVVGDMCVRNNNTGNKIALAVGANPAMSIFQTSVQSVPIIATGAAATLTGTGACATITTQVGGSWGGSAKCTGTTGASTLTITPGITSLNGWTCSVFDETTRANLLQQTSHSTTACVLTATSVTQNDVFVFSAMPF